MERIAPGLYVDDKGAEYFYLTAMYPCIAQRMLRTPGLYTPSFVVDILKELREEFHLFRRELMD